MNALIKPKQFPLPSSLKVVPGTERAQAAYPYYTQFSAADDKRFWFYNSMHFPEPMSAFDMVTAEAAYCALGAVNTRVHCLPTTLGIDHRIINGRVYIGGNAVTDPAELVLAYSSRIFGASPGSGSRPSTRRAISSFMLILA